MKVITILKANTDLFIFVKSRLGTEMLHPRETRYILSDREPIHNATRVPLSQMIEFLVSQVAVVNAQIVCGFCYGFT
jgi:hypothetical protein